MKALILAAGVGRRLHPFTLEHPKCLLRFGDRTLLEMHLEHLAACGIRDIGIVVGHLADQIGETLERSRLDLNVQLLNNPRYEDGSGLSLRVADAWLDGGDSLVMDADVLCGPSMFRRLLSSPSQDCALVDGRLQDSGEEVKAVVDASGRLVELAKKIRGLGRVAGESVGIFRFSAATWRLLAKGLARGTTADPRLEYEPVIDGLLDKISMRYAPVDDLDWMEIDFPKDVEKARSHVYPRLTESDPCVQTERQPLLFTPGPLTTSPTVKAAMQRDVGSRDDSFIALVRDLRQNLLRLAGAGDGYEAVLMQGSGTYGVEAALSSLTPLPARWLFLVNGAYGRRMQQMADILGLEASSLEVPEKVPVSPAHLEAALAGDPSITHVGVVHCETTTGIVNPVDEVCAVAARFGCRTLVDAMSSFGGIPLSLPGIDCMIASSNKCLESVPGLSFALVRRDMLEAGQARSLSLDLAAQWRGLEANGQFRFTPPTHVVLALARALQELEEEGGIEARAARYRANHQTLISGMLGLGFKTYLSPQHQGWIITSFLYPEAESFSFSDFYRRLAARGFVIYPGKLTQQDCFRIGTIGRIRPADVRALLSAVAEVLQEWRPVTSNY